jgi:hypothetical protein
MVLLATKNILPALSHCNNWHVSHTALQIKVSQMLGGYCRCVAKYSR